MSRRGYLIAAGALAALLVAGFALWWVFLRDDAPPPVALEEAVVAATSSTVAAPAGAGTTTTTSRAAVTTTTAATTTTAGDGAAVTDGAWEVDTGSFVGYRVREELANIGAATAVGRTPAVAGSLVLDGTTVTAVSLAADLTRLESDDSRRDGQLRRQALETNTFPTATFELTVPIELTAIPEQGVAITAEAAGELTLHGVTREVAVPVEAQLSGGVIVVVGSLPVVFADYDIDAPSSFVVLSVDDEGVMEFQLFFRRA